MTADPLQYFKALADETRLRLVNVLNHRELNVNELMSILDMGQSRISRHLKILSEAGLLESRRDGLWVFYVTVAEGEARRFLDAVLPFVLDGDGYEADRAMAEGVLEERSRKTSQFFNAIAEDWDQLSREVLGDFDLAGHIVERMAPGGVAVDLGCGTGHLLERMRGVAAEVIGVDGSARMLELARRRLGREASNVSLRIGDLEHLPLRDSEADFVSVTMVLHHLSSPLDALREAWRVLRPGGVLMISDFAGHANEAMRAAYGDRWLGFPEETLVDYLTQAGFTVQELERREVRNGLTVLILESAPLL